MRLKLKNFLNTIESFIRTDATVARVYQFPDRDITIAGTDDVATVQSDATQAISDAAAAASAASTADGKAVTAQADIDAHEALTNNPHSVTVAQVGAQASSADLTTLASGGTALQQPRKNSGNTAIEWYSPTTNPMTTIGDIIEGGASGIPVRRAGAAIGNVYKAGGAGSANLWGQVDPSTDILPGGSAGQSIRINSGATSYEYFTPASAGGGVAYVNWSASLNTTGFSSLATNLAYYQDDGFGVHMVVAISGTSNATTFTFAVPFNLNAIYGTSLLRYDKYITNNSVSAVGRIAGSGGSATITVQATLAGGAFTASGTKELYCEFRFIK